MDSNSLSHLAQDHNRNIADGGGLDCVDVFVLQKELNREPSSTDRLSLACLRFEAKLPSPQVCGLGKEAERRTEGRGLRGAHKEDIASQDGGHKWCAHKKQGLSLFIMFGRLFCSLDQLR